MPKTDSADTAPPNKAHASAAAPPASTPLAQHNRSKIMSGHTGEVEGIRFGRMAPTVTVSDMPAAIQFYTAVFGFEKTFENGNPVGFVILEKDQAELHLTLSANHKGTTQNVAHLLVSDASALYAVCERKNVRIVKRLRDADYGLRGFVFADPDGNRVDVGQPI